MQERINSYMIKSEETDKKLREKEFELTSLNIEHKKQIGKYKEEI